MTYAEALQWMAYRAKHGPLNTAERLGMHLANIQAMIVTALGGEAKPQDFLPSEQHKPQQGVTLESAMSVFSKMEGN